MAARALSCLFQIRVKCVKVCVPFKQDEIARFYHFQIKIDPDDALNFTSTVSVGEKVANLGHVRSQFVININPAIHKNLHKKSFTVF